MTPTGPGCCSGSARVYAGDPGGVADLEQALAIDLELNAPNAAINYSNLILALFALGDLDRGLELLEKGRQAAERFGRPGDLRALQMRKVIWDYWQDNWDAAIDAANQALAGAQAGMVRGDEPSYRLIRAWIRLARGDLRGAHEDADSAIQLAQAADSPEDLYRALGIRGRVLLDAGRTQEADTPGPQAAGHAAGPRSAVTAPDSSGDLALVLQGLGRATDLQGLARAWTPTPWRQAATAIATGDFEHAADLYTQIGSRPDEAFACLQAAKQLLGDGHTAEANAQLQRALGFYRRVKANAYLREGEALLAASA
jgi:tetratricopeptide (TPR) repeat protein